MRVVRGVPNEHAAHGLPLLFPLLLTAIPVYPMASVNSRDISRTIRQAGMGMDSGELLAEVPARGTSFVGWALVE